MKFPNKEKISQVPCNWPKISGRRLCTEMTLNQISGEYSVCIFEVMISLLSWPIFFEFSCSGSIPLLLYYNHGRHKLSNDTFGPH
jgi:hypothetical protein